MQEKEEKIKTSSEEQKENQNIVIIYIIQVYYVFISYYVFELRFCSYSKPFHDRLFG